MMQGQASHHDIKVFGDERKLFCLAKLKTDVLETGLLTPLPGPFQHLWCQVIGYDFARMRGQSRGED